MCHAKWQWNAHKPAVEQEEARKVYVSTRFTIRDNNVKRTKRGGGEVNSVKKGKKLTVVGDEAEDDPSTRGNEDRVAAKWVRVIEGRAREYARS